MPIVRNEALDRNDRGAGRAGAGGSSAGSSNFTNLYDLINDADRQANGDRYAWQAQAHPQSDDQRQALRDINEDRDLDEERQALGRSEWDQESMQDMSGFDSLMAGFSKAGNALSVDAGNDFASNAVGAIVGSLLSPLTAGPSAVSGYYEAMSGKPVSEANEDNTQMPDYELSPHEKAAAGVNATIDLAGLAFGGSRDLISSAARGVRYGAARAAGNADLASDIAREAAEAMPRNLPDVARRIGGSMLEEGLEEAAQSVIGDMRYDQFDDGTLGRALESGAWGAVGGAAMTGASIGINRFVSGPRPEGTPDPGSTPEQTHTTGTSTYDRYSTPAATMRRADTDIQERYEQMQSRDKFVPGSTNYKVVQGTPDLRPIDTAVGSRGLRKMYMSDDESRDYFVNAVRASGYDPNYTREQADALFESNDDKMISAAINDMIDNGATFWVYDKREPHTSERSVMRFRLARVNPGNTVMTNTMVPQMNGGDIDGDMMGFLIDPKAVVAAQLPVSQLTTRRPVPGSDGRYGSPYVDKDYIGFSLDNELSADSGWRDANGIDPVKASFDQAFSALGNESVVTGVDRSGKEVRTSLADKWRNRLQRAWNGKNGFDEFLRQYNDMRNELIEIAKKTRPSDAAEFVDVNVLSELIWNLQQNTGGYLTYRKMVRDGSQKVIEAVVNAESASPDDMVDIKGTGGRYTRMTTMASSMDMINQMFSSGGNIALRFQQNMFWRSTSTRLLADAIDGMGGPDEETFTKLVNGMMHTMSSDSTPMKQLNGIFKAYVVNDVMRNTGLRDRRIGGGLDMNAFLQDFQRIYDRYVSTYNKSLEQEGIEGPFTPIGTASKQDIKGSASLVRAFNDVFDTFDASQIIDYDDGSVRTWGDLVSSIADGDGFVDVMAHLGEDANDFVRRCVSDFGGQRASRGKSFKSLVLDIRPDFDVTWDESGRASIDQSQRQRGIQFWMYMKQMVGIDTCAKYGLINFDTAVNSSFGQDLFSKDDNVRLDAVFKLRLGSLFSDYMWNESRSRAAAARAEEATDTAARKNAEAEAKKYHAQAVAFAKQNFGASFLANNIVAEIVNNDSDNLLSNLLSDDLSYDEKSLWFDRMQSDRGSLIRKEDLLEAATRTPDSEALGDPFANEFDSARRAANSYKRNTMDAAKAQANGIISLITDAKYSTELVVKAMLHQMRVSSQTINSNLMAALYFDAADVVKGHVDKGSSTPTEVEVYQMIANMMEGGASSAVNRITGSTMCAADIVSASRNKQMILEALSDGRSYNRIHVNGAGYSELTRESVFEAVGIKLAGREPTPTDWIQLLDAFPQVATWMGDTSFNQVPGSDTVSEVQSSNVVSRIEGYLNDGDATRRQREVENIKSRILNDPNNARVILGIIGGDYPGTQFDELLESPRRWLDAWESAVDRLSRYEHYRKASGNSDAMCGDTIQTAEDVLSHQIDELVARGRQISSALSRSASDDSAIIGMIENDIARSQFSRRVVEEMRKQGVKFAGSAEVDSLAGKSGKAIQNEVARMAEAEKNLLDISRVLINYPATTYQSAGVFSDGSIAELKNSLRGALDGSNNVNFDDAFRNATDTVSHERLTDVKLPSYAESYLLFPEDMLLENVSETAKKIHDMRASGLFGLFKENDLDDIVNDLTNAAASYDARTQIMNRYNSLVISRAIDELYGPYETNANRGFYSATMEAYQQVNKLSDDIAMDAELHASSSSADVKTPRIDYRNRSLSTLADFTVSSLEGAGNALMSGVEGGEYQMLLSLAGYNGGVHSDRPPQLVRVGDIIEDFRSNNGVTYGGCRFDDLPVDESIVRAASPLDYPSADSFKGNLRLWKLTRSDGIQYDENSYIWVYPLDDAPFPDAEHMPPAAIRNGKRFDYLTDLLINMVYDRSEPGVFKRKKTIGLFDNVARRISRREDLARGVIARPTAQTGETDSRGRSAQRLQVVEQVKRYRREIQKQYYNEFVAERMDKEFGPYDAYLLAQLTTPFVEVSVQGQTMSVSMASLWDDQAYASLGLDLSQADSIRVVQMPLKQVCEKVSSDLYSSFSDYYRNGGDSRPSPREITDAMVSSLSDWSNYRNVGADGVREMLSLVPALQEASPTNIATARSSYAPANFISSVTGQNRGIVASDAQNRSMYGTIDADWRDEIQRVEEFIKDNLDKTHPDKNAASGGVIAFSIIDNNQANTPLGRGLTMSHSRLSLVNVRGVNRSTDSIPTAIAMLDDINDYRSLYQTAKGDDVVVAKLLVPDTVQNHNVIPSTTFTGRTVSISVNNQHVRFVEVDPSLDPKVNRYMGAVPDFFPITDDDIEFAVANYSISDSAALFCPDDTNKRLPMSSPVSMPRDVLFHGIRRASIEMPSGPADLDAFERAFQNRNEKGQREWSSPKFPAGNAVMDQAEIDASVRRYLHRARSVSQQAGNPCFIDEDVMLGDCIGFVKTLDPNAGVGKYVYAPVILNKGGIPAHIDRIYVNVDRRHVDQLQMWISGNLSATDVDGIKAVFPGFAFKAYGRYATKDEWASIAPKLGIEMGTGTDRFHVNTVYSGNTEDGRLIDRGINTLRENLYGAMLSVKGGIYVTFDDNGTPVRDYQSAIDVGLAPEELDRLLNVHHYDPLWDDIISGARVFHQDADVNMAVRKVAEAAHEANMSPGRRGTTISPAMFLGTFSMERDVTTGERRLVTYTVATDTPDFIYKNTGPDSEILLKLFHAINPIICKDGRSDTSDDPVLINNVGDIRVQANDGGFYYVPGHIMMQRLKHDSSALGIASSHAAYGNQQIINGVLEHGFSSAKEIEKAIQLTALSNGDYTPYLIGGRYYEMKPDDSNPWDDISRIADLSQLNALDFSYQSKVAEEGQRTFYRKLTVVNNRYDKEVLDANSPELKAIYDRLTGKGGFDFDVQVDPLLVHNYVKMVTGYSFNDGDGSHTITLDQMSKAVDEIIANLNREDVFFVRGGKVNDRYTIPLMPAPMMRFTFDHSRKIQNSASRNGIDYDGFIAAAMDEMDKTRDAVGTINPSRAENRSKKKSLETIIEFCYESNGQGFRGPSLAGFYSMSDVINAQNPLYRAVEQAEPDIKGIYDRRVAEFRPQVERWKAARDENKRDKIDMPMAPNGFVASWFGLHRTYGEAVAKNMILMSRTCAMAAMPTLPGSACLQRVKGSGMTKALIFLRNRGNYVIKDQNALRVALKSQDARNMWMAFNEISMNSDEMDAMLSIGSPEGVRQYLEDYHKRSGRLGRLSRKVFKWSTADGAFISWQMENFVNYFAQELDPQQSPWWFEEVSPGMTRLEARVLSDPAGFITEALTARDGATSDVITARRARNFAVQSELAQQTSVGLVLSEVFRKHSMAEFLITTNFLRFPNYVVNSSGWFMQNIAPVSSLYHWATSKLIQKAKSENPMFLGVDLSSIDLESTQHFSTFKEAAYNDAMSIGTHAIFVLLLSGLLGFEPPKNEDGSTNHELAGNLNEWTILGLRVDEPWWLQDILGPALALAAFAKSAQLGEPRLDIVTNWLGQAMWNNPMLRAADVASVLFDADEGYMDQMIEESELYADAKGGQPSLTQMWGSGLLTYGMNWASQFVTPSFLREMYRNAQEYEVTYKRTYVTDENGNIVTDESGMPYTTRTTYEDAQKRRLVRSNPFAALVYTAMSGGLFDDDPNKSYFAWDMPRTVYYRSDQLASVNYYSMYTTDEYGNQVPKSPAEINSIAWDVLETLAANDDMYELAQTGWVIPYDTREYVSKLLWDQVHYLDNTWSNWVENEAYDFTVLGDGDFGTGRQMYEEAKQAYNSDRQNLMDLYNKLWDDALMNGLEQYNSFRTTYQTDIYGNYYATGFKPGTFFNTAAGSVDDPGPTLGQLGNWETPAVSNPLVSTGRRALVGIDTRYTDVPSISSWSADGNGDGYSDVSALTVGSLVDNEGSPNDKSSRPDFFTYYNYGGRGGRGGGGSGYRPSIYSRLPNVYLPSARTMYAERVYGPNYDYLRPNFETKGSREAYKRSDI